MTDALIASVFVSPRAHGLSVDDLVLLGEPDDLRRGEIGDALRSSQCATIGRDGRWQLSAVHMSLLLAWDELRDDDPRAFAAFQFVHDIFDDAKRNYGAARAAVSVGQLETKISAAGLEKHGVDVALAIYSGSGIIEDLGEKGWRLAKSWASPAFQLDQRQRNGTFIRSNRFAGVMPLIGRLEEIEKRVPEKTQSSVTTKKDQMRKLFISHAVKDSEIVNAFVDLLESGLGIAPDAIFCSSRAGQGIPAGEHFIDWIRDELKAVEIVIPILSANFWASHMSVCELGAAWVNSRTIIPVLMPPLSFADGLRAVLPPTIQAVRISDAEALDGLAEKIANQLGSRFSLARWNSKKKIFLESLLLIATVDDRGGDAPNADR